MNFLMALRIQSVIAAMLAAFQLPALLLAFSLGEPLQYHVLSFLFACGLALGYFYTLKASTDLCARDGVLAVGLGWANTLFLGALPYVFSGRLGWIDALFESTSGFTTTGSSVLTDIEAWPQSLLLWRSTTQWLGGMGMLVLATAILPFLGAGGLQIMKAEVPGPSKDKLVPRVATTARILWSIYLFLTLLCILAFHVSGMTWLEAVNHAFTSMATGGFSTRNASFGVFSPAAQWWAVFFMTVAGINYVLHYRLLLKGDLAIHRDDELRWYLGIILGVGLFCAWVAHPITAEQDLETALRQGLFQVVTIITTTGYASTDWETWPLFAQLVLVGVMIPGSMAGSTAGGIKVVRLVIAVRIFSTVVNRMLMPERVVMVKLNGREVDRDIIESTVALVSAAAVAIILGTIILVGLGMDTGSAYSAALTAFSNVGPGIGSVGPMDNFASVHDLGKILLAVLMVLGRLEVFTLIMLFLPRFWRS
ncbi:MAG: TrkH family potassium uptake protein [Magnetococcales bacterium]|nr:TrkH family potassium uptake protein [Magnetococcales bacterium]